jgi:alpha-beta hydrolase superfamily lysophospholipase
MPYFDGVTGQTYYKRWNAPRPKAVIVFLHGYGEHSGFYHRLGSALNQSDIDLFALDEIGHGLTEGPSGVIDSIDDLAENARRLTALAADAVPGVPVFIMGHSLGAITAAYLLPDDQAAYSGAILTGALLSPVPWVMDLVAAGADASFELDLAALSADPLYLDEIENDRVEFSADDGARSLARVIPPAWEVIAERFLDTQLPILFIQGELDVLGPADRTREWADRLPLASIQVFEGQQHDIINETVHAEVVQAIVEFVRSHGSRAGQPID